MCAGAETREDYRVVTEGPLRSALKIELTEVDADSARLDELTSRLRDELLQLEVEEVTSARGGEAPVGSRAFEIAAVGALLVTINASSAAVASVIHAVRAWMARGTQSGRSVRLTLGDKTIELTGQSSETQEQLVTVFLNAIRSDEALGR